LAELRANKPRLTLLHYIVDISDDNPSLEILNFTHQLAAVKEARKFNVDAMSAELRSWKLQINQLQSQLTQADAELNELMKGKIIRLFYVICYYVLCYMLLFKVIEIIINIISLKPKIF
jgi:uncharacterized membrane protein (DUF106 family)